MAWEIVTHRGAPMEWAHWIDLPAARAWQRRLLELQSASINYAEREPPPLNEDVIRGVLRWLRACFEAASNLLRALNQPAAACPYYLRMYLAQVGGASSTFGVWDSDAVEWLLGQSEHARASSPADPINPTIRELGFIARVYPRVALWVNAELVDTYLFDKEPPDPSLGSPDERYCIIANPLSNFWGWCCKYWYPGPLDARRIGEATFLATVQQNINLMNGFCRELAREPLEQLVTRSRVYVAAKNLAEARRFGGTLVEDIARIRAEDDALGAGVDPTLEDVGSYGRSIGAAVAAVNPLVGAVIAGIASLPEILQGAFGRAVGRSVDMWGRVEPVYQPAYLGGTIGRGRQTPPGYQVAMPGAVDWSAFGVRVTSTMAPASVEEPGERPEITASVWGRARADWGLPAEDSDGA